MSFVTLGEIVDIKGGGTPDKAVPEYWNGAIPWASVKDFKSSSLDRTTDFITQAGVKNSATSIIPAGTIIVPTRMAVGKAAISTIDLAINQDLKALFPKKAVDPRYLLHALLASGEHLERHATGATVKGITLAVLKGLRILLPPLPEQRRIAGILDQADALRLLRRQSLCRLSDLGRAIFYDMFGDPISNPKGWEKVELIECVRSPDDIRCGPFGTQLLRSEFQKHGVPLWGIKQVNRGFAIPTHEYVTEEKAKTLANYTISPGDIVMTRKGTIGNCSVYPTGFPVGIMHSDLLRLRIDHGKCEPEFISDQLHFSPDIQHQIALISGGAIMQGINVGKLKKIRILRPPKHLQDEYMRRVHAVHAKRQSAIVHEASVNGLFTSLQHRAFRGEL